MERKGNRHIRVLIIEDNEDDVLLLLRELHRAGFDTTHQCVQSRASLDRALRETVWDVVISDYAMLGFTGFDALQVFQDHSLEVPFLVVSGTIGEETAVEMMRAGAHDYLMKDKLARLGPAIERELTEAHFRRERHYNRLLLERTYEELKRAYEQTLEGWSRTLELRERETAGHSQRVVQLTLRIAEAMGIDPDQQVHLRHGALLHDIGKIGIPDHILLKEGPLDEEELAVMRQHPVLAYELLKGISYLQPALDIPYLHHERWDGSGYPLGLSGESIPFGARIFAIVDVFDALTSDRPYRKAWSVMDTVEYIYSLSGTHFDPYVVDAFRQVVRDGLLPATASAQAAESPA